MYKNSMMVILLLSVLCFGRIQTITDTMRTKAIKLTNSGFDSILTVDVNDSTLKNTGIYYNRVSKYTYFPTGIAFDTTGNNVIAITVNQLAGGWLPLVIRASGGDESAGAITSYPDNSIFDTDPDVWPGNRRGGISLKSKNDAELLVRNNAVIVIPRQFYDSVALYIGEDAEVTHRGIGIKAGYGDLDTASLWIGSNSARTNGMVIHPNTIRFEDTVSFSARALPELVNPLDTFDVLVRGNGNKVYFKSLAKIIDTVVMTEGIDHALLDNLNSTNYSHLTSANKTDLTDGGNTSLHIHDDRYFTETELQNGTVDLYVDSIGLKKLFKLDSNELNALDGIDYAGIGSVQSQLNTKISGLGTDNYVAKYNGTNGLQNSIIYDDDTNVGIGTSSPLEKLDISGGIRVQQYEKYSSSYSVPATTWVTIAWRTGVSTLEVRRVYRVTLSTSGTATGGSSVYLVRCTEDDPLTFEAKRVSAIHLGTNYPSLQVNGTHLEIAQGHASSTYSVTVTVDTYFHNNLGQTQYSIIGVEDAISTYNGKVGIGTLSPAAELDVIGKTDASDTSFAKYFKANCDSSNLAAKCTLYDAASVEVATTCKIYYRCGDVRVVLPQMAGTLTGENTTIHFNAAQMPTAPYLSDTYPLTAINVDGGSNYYPCTLVRTATSRIFKLYALDGSDLTGDGIDGIAACEFNFTRY